MSIGEAFSGAGLWGSGLAPMSSAGDTTAVDNIVSGADRLAGGPGDAPLPALPAANGEDPNQPHRSLGEVISNGVHNIFGSGLHPAQTAAAPAVATGPNARPPAVPVKPAPSANPQVLPAADFSQLPATVQNANAQMQGGGEGTPAPAAAPPVAQPPTPPEQHEGVSTAKQISPTPAAPVPQPGSTAPAYGQPQQTAPVRRNIFGQPLPPTQVTGNPLADRAAQLTYERQRMQNIISNPLAPFTIPKEYQQAIQRAGELDQQAFQIQQEFQKQQDLRQGAYDRGLKPETINSLGPNPTEQSILQATGREFAGGSFTAAKSLMMAGEQGKAIMEQQEGNFMPALNQRNQAATEVIQRLNAAAASGQPVYDNAIKTLKDEGLDPTEVLGNYVPKFVVPDKAEAWSAISGGASGQVAQAKQMYGQYQNKQTMLGAYQPVSDKDEAAGIQNGYFKGTDGNPMPGGTSIKLADGTVASIYGQHTADNLQKYGSGERNAPSNATAENTKTYAAQIAAENGPKGAIDQYTMAKHFKQTIDDPKMTTTAAGVALISDELGAIGRDLAEGSKAAGSIGLSKMLDTKYGSVGEFLNKVTTNWSEFKGWMDSGRSGPPPKLVARLTPETLQGFHDIADFKFNQTANEVTGRIGGPMFTAGLFGIPLNRSGLDPQLQSDPNIIAKWKEGQQQYIADMQSHPWVPIGNQRALLMTNSNYPGANKSVQLPERDDNAPSNQKIIASPGHENPPPDGSVHAAQSGTTSKVANSQLGYAMTPAQNGIATPIKPAKPGAAVQTDITPEGASLLTSMRGSESNGTDANSYNLIVGGKRLTNFDDHPRQVQTVMINGKPVKSSAAGAYQFLQGTWDDVAARYSTFLPDRNADGKVAFTPQNQDKAAWLLAQDKYNQKTGRILQQDLQDPAQHANIMKALSGTWTSLPGGSEPNQATGSRVGIMQRVMRRLGQMYQPAGTGGTGPAANAGVTDVNTANPEFNPVVQQQRAGNGELATTGSTMGGLAGSVGGPVAGAAGGAIGGAAGQIASNYSAGRPLSEGVGREAAIGGVSGFVPGSRPVLGALARTVGGATIGGVQEAQNPDSTSLSIAQQAGKTGLAAGASEAGLGLFGLAMGKAGLMFNKFKPETQQELSDAGQILAKGKPEAPIAVAGQPVPEAKRSAYEADQKAYDDAKQMAEDHGFDPDDLAHAARTTMDRANVPVAAEKTAIGKGYEDMRAAVGIAGGKQVPKTVNTPLPDGPVSMVGKPADQGGIPKEYAGRAAEAENNITAPAATWSQKYQQLFDERSRLLEEARAASGGAAPDPNKARNLQAIADNVYRQQRSVMQYVFGPQQAPGAIAKLDDLHQRYATLMNATHGGDIVANMAKPGAEGLAARTAFKNYAQDDLGAREAAAALLNAKQAESKSGGFASKVGKYGIALIATKLGLPHFAAGVLAAEAPAIFSGWATARAAGAPVAFKAYLAQKAFERATPLQRQQLRAVIATQGVTRQTLQ